MDEMELLVEETYKHFHQNFDTLSEDVLSASTSDSIDPDTSFNKLEIPPHSFGLIYRIDKSASIFAIRTLISHDLEVDLKEIKKFPENYPSLRLIGEGDFEGSLHYFIVENADEAKAIQEQVHNRRFPMFEEIVCNISDPGFSWWLTHKPAGFQVTFRMSVLTDSQTTKLGPIGSGEIAAEKFKVFESLLNQVHLNINIQNEINRVQFNGDNDFMVEEIKEFFETGCLSGTLEDLFKFLEKKSNDSEQVESVWSYFRQLSAVRRFWIQVEKQLKF